MTQLRCLIRSNPDQVACYPLHYRAPLRDPFTMVELIYERCVNNIELSNA